MGKTQSYPLFTWEKGIVGTGFSIFTLVRIVKRTPLPFAVYLLRYPVGAFIPPHRDPLSKRRLFHLNIVLTKPLGGEFVTESVIFRLGRFVFFRPDLSTHSVTPVLEGTRYVLLIGWTLRDREKAPV
jgi:hypothetical protein